LGASLVQAPAFEPVLYKAEDSDEKKGNICHGNPPLVWDGIFLQKILKEAPFVKNLHMGLAI